MSQEAPKLLLQRSLLAWARSEKSPKALSAGDVVHSRLLRVADGGQILREINVGSPVFACMLGGDDGRTLFACTAPTLDEVEAARNHQASVITTVVDVPRAGLP